jgi:drug/metabolite transporter (DMT)-like permease
MRGPAIVALVAGTVLVLGANWPIMARGVELLPPLWLAAFRTGGAAILIATILAVRGRLAVPRRDDCPILWSIGLMRLGAVTALVFVALEAVPPGRSSILAYTGALWVAPLAAFVLHERLTWLRVVGLLVGTIGLVLLVEPWALDWGDPSLVTGIGMLLVAALINAASTVHIRKHRWNGSPFELMPWQLGLATLPIAALALATEGLPPLSWPDGAAAIVAYQIGLGSAFGLWGVLTLSRSLPTITANLSLMAVPIVGLVTSVLFTPEPLTTLVVLSLVLVLSGVGLGLLSDRLVAGDEPTPMP